MNPDQQVYIDTVRDQIKAGAYDHLLPDVGKLDVFLDIGANTGQVSRYFLDYANRVIAFEPDPDTFKILSSYRGIEAHPFALTPKDGPVDFYVNDINFTASSTVNTYGAKITVEGKTLATILKDYNLTYVDVAKIDCEGAEGESLDYAQLYNARDIIKCYFIEFHNCPQTNWEHKLGTTVGNLARFGYEHMEVHGMSLTARK